VVLHDVLEDARRPRRLRVPEPLGPLLRGRAEVVGEYLFDTKDFWTDDQDHLLAQAYGMTDRRFALAEHLLDTRPWDLFIGALGRQDAHLLHIAPTVLELLEIDAPPGMRVTTLTPRLAAL
jgi:hypothetical protein